VKAMIAVIEADVRATLAKDQSNIQKEKIDNGSQKERQRRQRSRAHKQP
jgi:hypothetical protein